MKKNSTYNRIQRKEREIESQTNKHIEQARMRKQKSIGYGCDLFILSYIYFIVAHFNFLYASILQYIFSYVISLHCDFKCFTPYQVSDIITRQDFQSMKCLDIHSCQFIIVVYTHDWPNGAFSLNIHAPHHAHGRCTCIGALDIITSSANAPRVRYFGHVSQNIGSHIHLSQIVQCSFVTE